MLPGSSGGSSHFREALSYTLNDQDLNKEDLDFLANHLSDGTTSGYGYAFNAFSTFCSTINADPHSCTPSIIIKYLRTKYEEGASYNTINVHKCAISKVHVGFNGIPIGKHPLVSRAMRAAFRLRPPIPKYRQTYDIVPVLNYVASLEPLNSLSLKLLTYKTIFLLITSTISRVSSIARLGAEVEEGIDCLIIPLLKLEKQGRPSNVRGWVQVQKFADQPSKSLSFYSK